MDYGITVELESPFAEAVSRVRAAFKEQGFGTLTEIDVQATLKEKLDVNVPPYLILGVCNPELARRALAIEPQIGLLLPCNVLVRAGEDRTIVQAFDPQAMVDISGNAALQEVAHEAAVRVRQAPADLAS